MKNLETPRTTVGLSGLKEKKSSSYYFEFCVIIVQQEEEKKKKEEREKASLERKYALPDNPVIIVHPNSVAKGGKFDCSLMSLSVLLDYRPEDNKEHSFEVRQMLWKVVL